MGYIKEFQNRLVKRDLTRFLELWNEYLEVDTIDPQEILQILNLVKKSDLKESFGSYVEMLLPMWQGIQDEENSYSVLRSIIDLETSQSDVLRQLAFDAITSKYSTHHYFKEGVRAVGLKGDDFKGALSKFDLFVHIGKGKFVYHTSGWGTGEIMDLSFIREQLSIEFENVGGVKDFSFLNAFKTLIPLASDSFLARRFANPDLLEKEAKQDPLALMKLLLKDLGPKTASEIKDEIYELVIPEKDWNKWWQLTRGKLKKDPFIEVPKTVKEPFSLRMKEKSLREVAGEILIGSDQLDQFIPSLHAFIRDYPQALKDLEIKQKIQDILLQKLKQENLSPKADLQLALFLEQYLDQQVPGHTLKDAVERVVDLEPVLDEIEVLALKKKVLQAVAQTKENWVELFLSILVKPTPAMIREYLLKELFMDSKGKEGFLGLLDRYTKKPDQAVDFFVWYFQKVASGEEIPLADSSGKLKLLEGLLILLAQIEGQVSYKEISKKIVNLLSGKRYEVVRHFIQNAPTNFLKEFVLLASKCHSFSEHDIKILHSLIAVVDPSLSEQKKKNHQDPLLFWVTPDSMKRAQDRLKHIATVETVENAREIEAARALGDLRENSEFKFAKERRGRLQAEIKSLSQEIQKARIITKEDVFLDEVGIGNKVLLIDSKGNEISYTILGPWDADPDQKTLSSLSPFAQAMLGKQIGDLFEFKNEEFRVEKIDSIFE